MKFYETGLIFTPQLDESEFDNEIKKITDFIESNSGKIEKVDRWGIRRLAYEIKKKTQGYYTFIYYTSPTDVPGKIETMLRINENCLRFMTIVPDFEPEFERPEREERPARQRAPEPSPEPIPQPEMEKEAEEKEEDMRGDEEENL
ncbi:MAG: 30S ribosomal protein S6 [candidate division Zixibacteria bacterium]|nr:30S ribosomal protein S6 [candidate division Zixibacteria bacterium]NIR65448.1 30S ribosomal protein S6 [candidate division Zixibacteria bacterium]NIS15348.1 30S ribosomal protein S6 [candidate division Zixibacteria bacterium]NIS47139.1 30S ribosomal protein S6 [candidate division Zixibacteria bacterium]NIT51873.1 30S ribosomal protein S6 [candidate division Zixibacteria bacterium]